MTPDEIRAEVKKIRWWHEIDLGNGIVTPGFARNGRTLPRIHMPEDLSGVSVIDIGAWDGFYSFEAERRGASRVLATDSFCWGGAGWGTQDGFKLVRKVLNSKVEDREIEVLELSSKTVGQFDLVLFLGVLYHMRHPLLALERVFDITHKQLILETHAELFPTREPMMRFYPGAELDDDPTNWWGPNPAAVEAMLRAVGFSRIEVVSRPRSLPYRVGRCLLRTTKTGSFFEKLRRDRIVFHAWR